MPEGDTIRRLAARLASVLVGKEVRGAAAYALAGASTLVGRTVTGVEAIGKNLLVRLDDGRALHIHLRMVGRVRVDRCRDTRRSAAPQAATKTPQLRLEVDGAVVTASRVPVLRLLAPGAERRAPELAGLGPDLCADDFDEAEAVRRLRGLGRRAPTIAEAILVQRALAGIGNVFKSETLFLERVDPRTRVCDIDDERLVAIVRRARSLLHKNAGVGLGPRSAPRRTRPSLAGPRVWVYDRAGRPCLACGAIIERIRQGPPGAARSTYHCPRCQR
jgi:endonuclease-8